MFSLQGGIKSIKIMHTMMTPTYRTWIFLWHNGLARRLGVIVPGVG
jgi:hypothetical protein